MLDDSRAYLNACQAKLGKEYGLSGRQRFGWDPEAGRLEFYEDDVVVLVATTQLIGSISHPDRTWLWGWANPQFTPAASEMIKTVTDFGHAHQFAQLTEGEWEADEADGWDMAAVCAYMTKSMGIYVIPYDTGAGFALITDIQRVPD